VKTVQEHPLLAMTVAATLAGCAAAPPCNPPSVPPPPIARTDFTNCSGDRYNRVGTPAVVRYAAGSTDSVRHPDRIIAGPHTALCQPGAIVRGPKGELYVLNQAAQIWWRSTDSTAPGSSGPRWMNWVTVYDAEARGDATPIRTLHVHTRGFGDPSSLGMDRDGYLYVGSDVAPILDGGSVAVFEAGADGNVAPIRVVSGPSTGLRWPSGLALDRDGYAYVINSARQTDDTVRVFAPAGEEWRPCRVIAGERTGLNHPVALAVDRSDRLYVASGGYAPGHPRNVINVYPATAAGDTAPSRTITGSDRIRDGMYEPRRRAIGRGDSLYVRSVLNLTVFGPGPGDTAGPARTFYRNAPDLFALDRQDTLYALSGNTVVVYPPGYSGMGPPVRTIGGPRTGIRSVTGLALDRRGWLYVAVGDSSQVRVFPPGASGDVPPSRTIAGWRTRLGRPTAIALDGSDRLYVTNGIGTGGGSAIRVYAPGARGEDQPVRILWGPETRLSRPGGVVFDSRGDMYVVSSGQVMVFRREAEGNEPPLRTIGGPLTLLRSPARLAIGPGDTLYVLNVFGPEVGRSRPRSGLQATVTAYPPGASGDVEPARYIVVNQDGRTPGREGGLASPRDLAVDTTGALRVWHAGGMVIYAPGARGLVAPIHSMVEVPVDSTNPAGVVVGDDGWVYQTNRPREYRLMD
jgi:hypothetical protein